MDCLCLAPASLLIFVHARPPISPIASPLQAPLAVAVMLVFCGAAALACARRMLHKPGGDPGGAYARVSSADVRRQSPYKKTFLMTTTTRRTSRRSPRQPFRKRNLEMVGERGGEFVF